MPIGTGTLFVTDPSDSSGQKMRRESKSLNYLERDEAVMIQYLIEGGHSYYTGLDYKERSIGRIFSNFHAGYGQQVFGCGPSQRCDLLLAFFDKSVVELKYHNYHGSYYHYEGHIESCPKLNMPFRAKIATVLFDSFRCNLALEFSLVRPNKVLFAYSVSTECEFEHGARKFYSLKDPTVYGPYESVRELVLSELTEKIWLKHPSILFSKDQLLVNILAGRQTGFVTIKGGRENIELVRSHLPAGEVDAGEVFGFCVQNFAPSLELLSSHTKDQIKKYFGWSLDESSNELLNDFISKLPPRTLNSNTFHSEETISTTYLIWLVQERGFCDFEITHFLHYKFCDFTKDYLEPLLQKRHEYKQQGNTVAAECFKIAVNAHYGMNGLESCNYDDTRLMTDLSLHSNRRRTLAHVSLKHVSLIGVVKTRIKQKKKFSLKRNRDKIVRRRKSPDVGQFLFDEAAESNEEEDDFDEDGEVENPEDRETLLFEDEVFLENEISNENLSAKKRGMSESDTSDSSLSDAESDLSNLSDDLDADTYDPRQKERAAKQKISNDLDDILIRKVESKETKLCLKHRKRDHDYAALTPEQISKVNIKKRKTEKKSGRVRYKFNFLLAVIKSGERKPIKNALPRAVAVLSNSKALFLGHINLMLKCLDSGLAEICYVDTDSALFSTTYENLEDCLKPELKQFWNEKNILADEAAQQSCHGKMKLEGMFRLGHFKSLKIYRLFNSIEAEQIFEQAYTRCKGVNRKVGLRLPDFAFDTFNLDRIVVHKTSLRPTRTGEITMSHEAKTLARPFNLKRYTTNDGIHTLPISYISENPPPEIFDTENFDSTDDDESNDF